MKKNILSLLLLVGVVLTSCSKETPVDARDKFVGDFQGTFQYQFTGSASQSSTSTHVITKSSTNSNQIIIDGTQVANVNGNSYTYVQYTQIEQDPTYGAVTLTLNGVGTLNGANLNESGTLSMIVQGTQINGNWSSNLVKQ